jgi:uncharacterized membrane protein HdeD (DUF308 family)
VVQYGISAKLGWQLQVFTGIVTLILGIILTAFPSTSLNVVCVIIGIMLIIGGIFHFIRLLDRDEPHRAWLGLAGLLEVVIGVVLIRHLGLSRALIGLLVGLVWIIQGIVAFLAGVMGTAGRSRAWPIIFGIISIAAGIVVVSVPANSVKVLAVLLGIWFIVMGILEIASGLFLRHDVKELS